MTGTACALIAGLLPKTAQRIAAFLLVLIQCVLAEIQLIYHAVFGNMMPISQISMGGGVIAEFMDQTIYAIRQNIVAFILLLLPLAVLLAVLLRKGLSKRISWKQALTAPILLALLIGAAALMMTQGCRHPITVLRIFRDAGTSTDLSYRNVGMTATTLQELRYILFGGEEAAGDEIWQEEQQIARLYDPETWNIMPELDFEELEQNAESEPLAVLDRYCAQREPTPKNQYTGMLKDYNVIVFCAESFSPLLLDEQRTPVLYKMSRNGFVFHNYYGTFNSVTTNGEYSTCLGLLPDMGRAKEQSSFDASVGHYLPFCLGTILKDYGYKTWAYHNNNGEFYNRSQTHPNMGYTFKAQGSGLNITPQRPASDVELIEQSVGDFLNSDELFHAYYMTYSGHYHYTWDNAMSRKHQAEAEFLPYPSEEVRAYIACNLELEAALALLEKKLEEAGKLDNTVIVLTNDHYPYGLSQEQYDELAGHAIDTDFEKFHNSFICYCPGLEETIDVDTYCSTTDVLPTMLNLLGVEYDSRMLAGTDALSEGRHAAVIYNGNFIADGFRYCEETGELITEDGVEVDPETLRAYRAWVTDKFTFSREVLNTDYYSHVFPNSEQTQKGGLEIPYDDSPNARVQGNTLFIYRKGLMDLYAERSFGYKELATLGVYITAIYRYAGAPKTTEDYLPENYMADSPGGLEAFRKSPWYPAACWAFETGLLRADDRVTDCSKVMDNVEFSLMIYRTYEFLGERDMTVEDSMYDELPEIHNPNMTDTERAAVAWIVHNKIINGGLDAHDIFDELEENQVTRYRVVLILLLILYPEMTR